MVEKLGPRMTGGAAVDAGGAAGGSAGAGRYPRKMMARLPEDRYQTPLEAAQALQSITETPIALAMPVALALPVSAAMANVPLATPIAAGPPPDEDSAFRAMSASGRDMSSPGTAAKPRDSTRSRSPSSSS